jgi:hypothetical protein
MEKIHQLQHELNNSKELTQLSLPDKVEQLRHSQKILKENQQEHVNLREEHLNTLAEA